MTRKGDLPRRVYLRHGRYFVVDMAGKWLPLTRERDGLPAMYRALANIQAADVLSDRLPAVAARWLAEAELEAGWSEKHATNQARYARTIGDAFREFTPALVTTAACNAFLKSYAATPRTFNAYRTALRSILALAAREGLRDGHNPVDDIPRKRTPGRHRAVSDAEVAAIRAHALSLPRNGAALAQMIDLALLTGQRIGDLIRLRWQDVGPEGIAFVQGKGQGRVRLLVEWSPALQAAITACERGDRIGHVLQKETGGPYRYAGIRSAWVRACEAAGVTDLHIHDLRGRAGVDALGPDEDMRAAQRLLGHSSEGMTRFYVEGKYSKRTRPAK